MNALPKLFTPPHMLSGLPKDTPLLLALSGGADSCALLHMLLAYAKESGAPLAVAHVDHGIRGEEAERDRAFCQALAEAHRLPFYQASVDVPALAAEHGRGIEEEARAVRYDFFASVMAKENIPLLVTAHNADDNAETLLFRMTRGTSPRGLGGIPPVRPCKGGVVIRPLLRMSKKEILDYCKENAISYVTDSTNADVLYARNRIRHNVLSELCKLNASAVQNMTRLSETIREEESFWEQETAVFLAIHATDTTLVTAPLLETHKVLARRSLAKWLSQYGIDPSHEAISSVFALAKEAKAHASLDLSGGTVTFADGKLLLSKKRTERTPSPDYRLPFDGNLLVLSETMCLLREKEGERHEKREMCQNIYKTETKTRICFDRIDGSLFVRPRRPHDVILSGGMHKKVKKLLCDNKIPLALRDSLPLLCDNSGILWIPGVALRDGAANGEHAQQFTLFYNQNS